ncbi:hypothetical protein EVAR_53185_1 [Eumeta japonica]|uniref:Uncharacterized protein n=1 Tax=Eumeta variegata TaxID=151549 RepID=A0A4C1Z0C2_EUMVA|nr:hypothetical protein EVAR_53185_1 [Eumeta japonica]
MIRPSAPHWYTSLQYDKDSMVEIRNNDEPCSKPYVGNNRPTLVEVRNGNGSMFLFSLSAGTQAVPKGCKKLYPEESEVRFPAPFMAVSNRIKSTRNQKTPVKHQQMRKDRHQSDPNYLNGGSSAVKAYKTPDARGRRQNDRCDTSGPLRPPPNRRHHTLMT